MTKTKDPICRSFRQDFPQFVERALALGVNISLGEGRRNGRERVFWLDGYKQLTGYTTRSDGSPHRGTGSQAIAARRSGAGSGRTWLLAGQVMRRIEG
jgi:hypothetical protein